MFNRCFSYIISTKTIKKAVFVKIVVKILKPILTWKHLFCALEFSLQALFLINFFCFLRKLSAIINFVPKTTKFKKRALKNELGCPSSF
ncbi:hypothetical protein QFZ28_005345 [Neobacillus niacini]|nr:hypothetical protein [Neobacillus niacini]